MAYNEEHGLEPTMRELVEVMETQGLDWEAVIVDDGSSDGTAAVASRWASDNIRVVRHEPNQGLGAVYRTGLREASGDWITFLPADGQLPPRNLPRFLELRSDYDLLLGTLALRKRSLAGRVLSFVERLMYRVLFGYFPPFQGLFMARRELTQGLRSPSGRGWGVVMELILRAVKNGARWRNVACEFHPRLSGHSKVQNLRTISANLRDLLTLRSLL